MRHLLASLTVLVLGAALLIPDVQAQTLPQQVISAPCLACGARGAVAADLNDDGTLDVVSVSEADDKIAWYAGDGDGGFGEQQVISTDFDRPNAVDVADLNNDGYVDIVVGTLARRVVWFENDTDGTFTERQTIASGGDLHAVTSVHVADLNADDKPDVLYTSYLNDKVAWHANDGDGNFGGEQLITTNADGARGVYVADLDSDGFPDVISASAEGNSVGKVAWYENQGDGTFGAQQVITTQAENARAVYAADLDDDGTVDVLSASFSDSKIAWYENDGSGTFSGQQEITTDAKGAVDVHVADVNGDGDLDVLSASQLDGKFAWYAGDGAGGFGPEQIIAIGVGGTASVVTADLDGEDGPDVLTAAFVADRVAWYANDGAGDFNSAQVITAPDISLPRSLHTADLNGDGASDILSASFYDDKIAWYPNNGIGGFESQQVIALDVDGAESVHAGDLDGDDDVDVLSASSYDDEVAWHENDGDGNFVAKHVITTDVDGARAVYADDLDDDGNLDVLAGGYNDGTIRAYYNDGNGNFTSEEITTNADGLLALYVADLNKDGHPDVLSASGTEGGSKVAWYPNDGDGNFEAQNLIPVDVALPSDLFVTDLNDSGWPDILTVSSSQDRVVWIENQGGNNFGDSNDLPSTPDGASGVHATDLNGDGHPDVLVAERSNNEITWYRNDGQGGFDDPEVVTSEVAGPTIVLATDLDGDGRKDILSASTDDNKIAWYKVEAALPVELTSFEAFRDQSSVRLTWTTASEVNNAGFAVERRTHELDDWIEIGYVEGTGTTSRVSTYQFRDTDLPFGADRFRYRLKQVDRDGTGTYTEAVTIALERPAALQLHAPYPNPTSGAATVRYELPNEANVRLIVLDALGRHVLTLANQHQSAGRNEIQLNTAQLSSGLYFLRLEAGGRVEAQRLTIVR